MIASPLVIDKQPSNIDIPYDVVRRSSVVSNKSILRASTSQAKYITGVTIGKSYFLVPFLFNHQFYK